MVVTTVANGNSQHRQQPQRHSKWVKASRLYLEPGVIRGVSGLFCPVLSQIILPDYLGLAYPLSLNH